MRILLDTHAILYATSDVSRLGRRALRLIESPGTMLYGSLASLREIAIKLRIGKLELPVPASVFWSDAVKRVGIIPMAADEAAILKTLDFDLSHLIALRGGESWSLLPPPRPDAYYKSHC